MDIVGEEGVWIGVDHQSELFFLRIFICNKYTPVIFTIFKFRDSMGEGNRVKRKVDEMKYGSVIGNTQYTCLKNLMKIGQYNKKTNLSYRIIKEKN